MYHQIHHGLIIRFDLYMKGISQTHPFSLFYSLCICICFHLFLCANINSQINADSLKPTWKTPGFVSKLHYSTNAALFSPLSVSIHVSEQRTMSYIHSGVPLCCSRLLATGLFPCTMTPKLRALCSTACENTRDRLCVSFHRSP